MDKIVREIKKLEKKLGEEPDYQKALEIGSKIGKLYLKVKTCPRCSGTGLVDIEEVKEK